MHRQKVEFLSSTGFTISGDANEMFLNDDGNGVIRMFYFTDGTTKTYKDETAGTIDYNTGKIELTALEYYFSFKC